MQRQASTGNQLGARSRSMGLIDVLDQQQAQAETPQAQLPGFQGSLFSLGDFQGGQMVDDSRSLLDQLPGHAHSLAPGATTGTGGVAAASAAAGTALWTSSDPEPPVDWSLRSRVRLLSPLPFAWCTGPHREGPPAPIRMHPRTVHEQGQRSGGVGAAGDDPDDLLGLGGAVGDDDQGPEGDTPQQRLQAALMHWIYPAQPFDAHHPLLQLAHSGLSRPPGVARTAAELEALGFMHRRWQDWEAAFQHLWRLYSQRRIPYFYYCAPQITVLFAHAPPPPPPSASADADSDQAPRASKSKSRSNSRGVGGAGGLKRNSSSASAASSASSGSPSSSEFSAFSGRPDGDPELWQGTQHIALVSGSGSRFRKMLQAADVAFHLPFLSILEQKLAATFGGADGDDGEDADGDVRMNGKARDDDEAARSDLAARKAHQFRRLRQHLQMGDGADLNYNLTLASSLRLCGLSAVHGLYDCLLNEVQRLPTEDVPILRCPDGFVHGSLYTAQLSRPRVLRRPNSAPPPGGGVSVAEDVSSFHSLEVSGVLLPSQIQRIVRLVLRQQENQVGPQERFALQSPMLLEAHFGPLAPSQNLNAAGDRRMLLEIPRRSRAAAAVCPATIGERPELRQTVASMMAVTRKYGPGLTVMRSSGTDSGWTVKTAR